LGGAEFEMRQTDHGPIDHERRHDQRHQNGHRALRFRVAVAGACFDDR
jgi:hypothetical protein